MPRPARTVALVACASTKRSYACAAKDLYVSSLFVKARAYAESRASDWFILSAEHGALEPHAVIEPYDRTLNTMGQDERAAWARRVLAQLDEAVQPGDTVVMLAGNTYREGLVPALRGRGVHVDIPMAGMRIGEQVAWLSRGPAPSAETSTHATLDAFYELLDVLATHNGLHRLGDIVSRIDVPQRGVYFFLDSKEPRRGRDAAFRVVRVGTHALIRGAKSTMIGRLRQHRGQPGRGGDHRGSIFRLHVGGAILKRTGVDLPSWGTGLARGSGVPEAEVEHERRVSRYLAELHVVTLGIADEPGPTSLRGYVERNAIALLASAGGEVDPPSPNWLGRSARTEAIVTSGLWNVNHVDESVDVRFVDQLEALVRSSGRRVVASPGPPEVEPVRAVADHVSKQTKGTGSRPAGTGDRPRAPDFERALSEVFAEAARTGAAHADIQSGDLHRRVGGYHGSHHAMPTCCHVMHRAMRPDDEVLRAPPSGKGATLVIRYRLPR